MNIYRGRTHTEFYLASLLYDAVEDNDITSVLALLKEKHADPNLVLPRTGVSSFHLAVGSGTDHSHDESITNDNDNAFDVQCTLAMLSHGAANPNVRTDEGLTPLHVAAAWGRQAIVHLLLRNGANPAITDNCYRTAQMYAELEGYADTAKLLQTYVRQLEADILRDRLEEPAPNRQCDVVFDKLIVHSGEHIAEYEVTATLNHLHNLPTTNIDKYVATWCAEHNRNTPRTTDTSRSSLIHIPDESDGGMGTSRDPSPLQHHLVAVRRTSNEHRPITQPINNKKDSDASGMCKCSTVSRESGIMTLAEDSVDSVTDGLRVRSDSGAGCGLSAGLTGDVARLNIARVRNRIESQSIQTISSDSATSSIVAVSAAPDRSSSDYFTCAGTNDTSGATSGGNPHELNVSSRTSSSVLSGGSDSVAGALCISINNSDCGGDDRDIVTGRGDAFVLSALNKGMMSDDSGASAGCISAAGSAATSLHRQTVTVQEVYRYTDDEHNVRLFEKRLILPRQSTQNHDDAGTVSSSRLSSLPGSFDYDTDTLRKELTAQGFEPGPITNTTRRVYLRKLYRLKMNPPSVVETPANRPQYSNELERTLRHVDWSTTDLSVHLMNYRHLDEAVSTQFRAPDSNRRWREGNSKCSFTYLLLDPRVTQNLPARAEQMPFSLVWRTFISGIFYVGKGKRSRPYRHLYDAVQHWGAGADTPPTSSVKLRRIVDIWRADSGVICLLVFQNVIPVEAYCREAAMICALGKENVTNVKAGEFYGVTAAWSGAEKRQFGVYLLYRAMQILLFEGERQLCPADIE